MSKFQKCLASITVDCFDSGREVTKTPELLTDFPEILKDAGSADSIYHRIYGKMDWESARTDECLVSVGERDLTYKSEFIEVKLDLPRYFAHELIDGYEGYAAQDGKYEKEEVLDKAVSLLCEKLDYMHRDLQQTATRGLLDSHNLVIAHRRDFGLSLEEERRESSKRSKIKLKPGPKPAGVDDLETQKANRVFSEALRILNPGFDHKVKIPNKMQAIFAAVEWCNSQHDLCRIQGPSTFETEDKLHAKRSVRQAALALTAEALGKSRQTIERYLSKN